MSYTSMAFTKTNGRDTKSKALFPDSCANIRDSCTGISDSCTIFCSEFCKIFQNSVFAEHHHATASDETFLQKCSVRNVLKKKKFSNIRKNNQKILKRAHFQLVAVHVIIQTHFQEEAAVCKGDPKKKVILKISQISQENTFGGVSF